VLSPSKATCFTIGVFYPSPTKLPAPSSQTLVTLYYSGKLHNGGTIWFATQDIFRLSVLSKNGVFETRCLSQIEVLSFQASKLFVSPHSVDQTRVNGTSFKAHGDLPMPVDLIRGI
jgi:hypothetical protein